jgi:hypothetical protein
MTVQFANEQVEDVGTVNTAQQDVSESNSHSESSEDSASEGDKLEKWIQKFAIKDYQEKVLWEQLAIKERELAEVELLNRQLAQRLNKERGEKLKLSEELKKRSAPAASANPDMNARIPYLQTLRDTGTIQKSTNPDSRDQQLKDFEQSHTDREAKRSRLQPDLSYDFQTCQGDLITSSPAYTGLTIGAAGGGVNGDQPPNDN